MRGKGVKGGNYWRSVAYMVGKYLADMVRLVSAHTTDIKVAEKMSEYAYITKSLIKKDGEYELRKVQTDQEIKAELLAELNEAVNSSLLVNLMEDDAVQRVSISKVLSDVQLSGNDKQVLLFCLAHGVNGMETSSSEREDAATYLGISEGTVRRAMRKIEELNLEDYYE
jgi:hypothetical protein